MADLKGHWRPTPPLGPNSLIFMQFLEKNCQNNRSILDPALTLTNSEENPNTYWIIPTRILSVIYTGYWLGELFGFSLSVVPQVRSSLRCLRRRCCWLWNTSKWRRARDDCTWWGRGWPGCRPAATHSPSATTMQISEVCSICSLWLLPLLVVLLCVWCFGFIWYDTMSSNTLTLS